MFFLILGRILMFLLIILAFIGVVSFLYNTFFKQHLVEDEAEDILGDAADRRILNEAQKAANDIEFGEINETKEDASDQESK